MGSAQTQTEEEMLSNYSDQKYIACIFPFTPSRKLLLGLGKVVHELYKYQLPLVKWYITLYN
jgi:hypothetical protein